MKEFFRSTWGKIAAVAVAAAVILAIFLLTTSGAGADSTAIGIGLDQSIAKALANAGLKEDQVRNLQGHFEKDDGLDAYEVSFTANNYEYEYIIKAADGAILECKIESPEGLQVTADSARDIGQEKALNAALTHAGLKQSEVELTKSRKDSEDGYLVYEFDFLKDNVSFEYDVDGTTGGILEFSREVINKSEATSADGNSSQAGAGTVSAGSSEYIGADKAKVIALENAGVKASAATFTAAKLDRDDGRYVYEIDFYTQEKEYDYEIDAASGKILEQESEPLDDWDDVWDD